MQDASTDENAEGLEAVREAYVEQELLRAHLISRVFAAATPKPSITASTATVQTTMITTGTTLGID